jgi:hypothetical protein
MVYQITEAQWLTNTFKSTHRNKYSSNKSFNRQFNKYLSRHSAQKDTNPLMSNIRPNVRRKALLKLGPPVALPFSVSCSRVHSMAHSLYLKNKNSNPKVHYFM